MLSLYPHHIQYPLSSKLWISSCAFSFRVRFNEITNDTCIYTENLALAGNPQQTISEGKESTTNHIGAGFC